MYKLKAIFYITKRTLLDILRTGVFWVGVGLIGIIIFSILYWGWHMIEAEELVQGTVEIDVGDEEIDSGKHGNRDSGFDPTDSIDPAIQLQWWIYGITIGFSNLLAIFINMGLLGKELDRKTIDMLIARPVSRGQIFFGKLLAGWTAILIYVALVTSWTMICMEIGGMGSDSDYIRACGVGLVSPILIGSMTLVISIWMRNYLAGLLAMVSIFASGTGGLFMIKMIGVNLLKMELPVKIIFRCLPPMSVIGQTATEYLDARIWFRMMEAMTEGMWPGPEDGLYTEMWHVFAYLGVVLLAGWLSFFRKQFN